MPRMQPTDLTVSELAEAVSESLEDQLLHLHGEDVGDLESLLHRPVNEWPSLGNTSELATFAANKRMYTTFLGSLAKGIRVTTAAKAMRVLQNKVEMWLKKGAEDIRKEVDSVYAWFYLDCFQARGLSEAEAEFRAFKDDPTAFLKRIGVGGQFNDLEQIGIERVFRQLEGQTDINEEDDGTITSHDVAEALKALNVKGALDLEQYAKEAQSQIPTPNEEPAPSE